MRVSLYFAIVFLLAYADVNGQNQDLRLVGAPNYIKIDPGNEVILQINQMYRFPDFIVGTILFRDGKQLVAKLNYNVAMNELRFINDESDTVGIAQPETIAYAAIDKYKFYFVRGKYLQTIETTAGVTLAYTQEINTLFSKSFLAYANSNHDNEYVINLPDFFNADQKKLSFNSDGWSGTVNIAKYFYFGDGYGNFTKASKSNLLAYFEKQAPLIKQYLNQHAIDFRKLGDIKDVLRFCDTLN